MPASPLTAPAIVIAGADIRLAEMLIARSAAPDPAALADPPVALKSVVGPLCLASER